MSKKPRTPVHFPRMRVRGHRNRRKLAARRESLTVVPMMRLHQTNPYEFGFEAVTTWEPGTFRLEYRIVHDGYGRVVGRPKATATPIPDPNPTPAGALLEFITGRRPTRDAS